MSHKKPENFDENLRQLLDLCDELGYEIEKKDTYQYRIYGATHVIDIWPSRMVYHRLYGEESRSIEQYHRGTLDLYFNRSQVQKLLDTGEA